MPIALARWRANPKDNDIRFETLSLDQGLSQSVVTSILQDQRGYLWFGTQDGLNRYDGYEFRVFKHDPQDPGSLSTNYISTLLEDMQGTIWIGTNGGGLDRFDPSSERFKHYQNDPRDTNSLSSNILTSLALARDGSIWVGTTGGGLDRYDSQSDRFTHHRFNPDAPDSLSSDSIFSLQMDREGGLWIGTLGGGLDYLEPGADQFIHFQNDPQDPDSLISNSVLSLEEGRDGNLWIGTDNGVSWLEVKTGRFRTYQNDPQDPGSLSSNTIFSIFLDRAGTIWVGTSPAGFNRYEPSTDRFIHYTNDPANPASFPPNGVMTIYQDRTGILWFGTFGAGLAKYDSGKDKFTRYQADPSNPLGLSDNGVWTFLEDSHGDFWVGTAAGGLNHFDRDTETFTQFRHDPADPQSLSSDFVIALLEDKEGQFWIGTQGGGLNLLDRTTGKAVHYLTPLFINQVFLDQSNTLWLATGEGLSRYDPGSDTFSDPLVSLDDPTSLSGINVLYLYQDRNQVLWAGTFSNGLYRLDPEGERWTNFQNSPEDPGSLGSNTVLSIKEDSHGRLWIGTAGGLDRYDPNTGTFAHLREKDGLPNNLVYGILEDEQGYLWLSTNRGLSKFNPDEITFKNYDIGDGLPSNEFNMNAFYQSESGKMYFGGICGFVAFDPDMIQDNPFFPPVVITDFQLFNTSVVPGPESPLQKAIGATEAIRLTYRQNFFSFQFAALDYGSPERNQYAYLMEGLDPAWNQVSTRRYAIYTNVPPGDYVFRVRGSNSDGVWNEQDTSIRIVVTPPFWNTWWFRAGIAILLIGLVAGSFTLRLRSIERQRRQLEVLISERTRELNNTLVELRHSKEAAESANRAKSAFLSNISHELRTPLNAILGFSQLMIKSAGKEENDVGGLTGEQRENLEVINRSGQHLLGLINDVLEMSKIEAGRITLSEGQFDLINMLEGLEDMFRLRAEDKGLSLDFEIEPSLPRYIQSDEGKLRQMLMNLLGNAVKFTQEGGVALRAAICSSDPEEEVDSNKRPGETRLALQIQVADTGPGIPVEDQENIFKPFVQASSVVQTQEGTGLGLSITRQYAQLTGGSLSLASEVGRGSVFTLRIPVLSRDLQAEGVAFMQREVTGLAEGEPIYRILVVDDSEVNRKLLVRLLAPLGFDVQEAANGKDAIQVWEEWEPHLIWMDMRMPVMDGYEATRRIKGTVKGQATVIVALTASALEEDRNVILSEGCDDYIRKPFQERDLLDALVKHLGVRFLYRETEAGRPEEKSLQAGRLSRMAGEELNQAELVDRLAVLPAECLNRMQQGCVLGSLDSILAALETIRQEDAFLAGILETWVNQFEHERILELIEKTRRPDGSWNKYQF